MSSAPARSHSLLILLLVLALVNFLNLTGCKRAEEANALPPATLLVTKAVTRDVPVYREWLGTLDGSENAQIRARVTGHVISRDYQEGSRVKKGDLLFKIDPRPFETAVAEAKFQLAQGAAVQCASQAEYDRSVVLFEKCVISEKEFINRTQLNESNKAKVKALIAALAEANLNLGFTRITSPIDGVVAIAQAHIGDLVGTGNNMVLTSVSTIDPIKIVFPISESDYLAANPRVEEIMKKPLDQRPSNIELVLAGGSIYPHKARFLSVDLQLRASTGTILVTAIVPNPGNVLRAGFFARARIVASVLKGAVVVPQRAVNEIQGSYQLWIVGADGKAETRPVTVGDRVGTDWVITAGLKKGETVIVEGAQKVKAGMPVNAKPWKPNGTEETSAEGSSDTKQ